MNIATITRAATKFVVNIHAAALLSRVKAADNAVFRAVEDEEFATQQSRRANAAKRAAALTRAEYETRRELVEQAVFDELDELPFLQDRFK